MSASFALPVTMSFFSANNAGVCMVLRISVLNGNDPVEIDVETYASLDGAHVAISLQSPGANDIVEEVRNNLIGDIVDKLREVAPEIVIIEQ